MRTDFPRIPREDRVRYSTIDTKHPHVICDYEFTDTKRGQSRKLMQTPSTPYIWLSEQAVPLAIIVALLGLVMIVLYASARARKARMNEARSGVNEDTFVNSLLIYGFDPVIARTTFRYLQEKQRVSFPIEATDMLDEDLGLGLSDVEESVQDILKLTERLYQPGLKHAPLVTVEDLVRLVQASPRLSEMAA